MKTKLLLVTKHVDIHDGIDLLDGGGGGIMKLKLYIWLYVYSGEMEASNTKHTQAEIRAVNFNFIRRTCSIVFHNIN